MTLPHIRNCILLFALFVSLPFCSIASGHDSTRVTKEHGPHIHLVPAIAYAPETRFLVGLGGYITFRAHHDSETHYSLLAAFIAVTQRKQEYIYAPYLLYFRNNNYYIEGEADLYNFSYYYWGISTERVNRELYDIRFARLQANGYKRILSKLYAGIDYYLEDDKIIRTDPGGELCKGIITGSKGSVSSGFGLDLVYDTRDSIYFPRKGWYIKGVSYFNEPVFGASNTYGKAIGDISHYSKLSPGMILALNEHTQFSWGNAPFNQLALVGGSKQMRGYYLGYYRDDILTFMQAETRIHLFGRFGFDAFGAAGFFGNYTVFPETPRPIFAEGIGLRYNYEAKQHVNIRFDVGYGRFLEYYLNIAEAF